MLSILSLTIFSVNNYTAPEKRLSGSFTLILTLFNFKLFTSNTLPTISYLTSLDKYIILTLIFIVFCSGWHAISGALIQPLDYQQKVDKIMLGVLGGFFLLTQFWLLFSLIKSYMKIFKLNKKNKEYEKMISNYPYLEEYDF